jgi:hypothetical protein
MPSIAFLVQGFLCLCSVVSSGCVLPCAPSPFRPFLLLTLTSVVRSDFLQARPPCIVLQLRAMWQRWSCRSFISFLSCNSNHFIRLVCCSQVTRGSKINLGILLCMLPVITPFLVSSFLLADRTFLLSAAEGHFACVKKLASLPDAQLQLRNADGLTPEDLAAQASHRQVAEYLREQVRACFSTHNILHIVCYVSLFCESCLLSDHYFILLLVLAGLSGCRLTLCVAEPSGTARCPEGASAQQVVSGEYAEVAGTARVRPTPLSAPLFALCVTTVSSLAFISP